MSALVALAVFACTPEWGALVHELGGERAEVTVATTARQDPHRIEARPSLIARARRADLVVCTGAELEIGWLPQVLAQSGNARVQPGRSGYFEAARHVPLLEKPAVLDRAMGDVHADGNPHLHLDPRNLLKVAEALAARLAILDAANAAHYAARHRDFAARMQGAIARWEKEGAALKDVRVVVHHKTWSYLAAWLGLKVVADLEPKPGIEPSAVHLAQMLARLKAEPAKMVLRTPYQSPRGSRWIAERAGIPELELPYTVGGSDKARDLFSLFDDTLAKLQAAAR
ncbi:MAG: zinc ABC transporter substrate-binding protein [Burkholderiales bacterium]